MRKVVACFAVSLFVALIVFVSASEARDRYRPDPRHSAGQFDYYTIAMSWSPTYCATRRGGRFDPQCDGRRPYAFVLHGLWPQYNRGWPQNCYVEDNWVPNHIIKSMLDIMPSKRLVIHQWKKHGVCSGLGPEAFFALSRKAFETIKIPARYISPSKPIVISPSEIENDFLKTNNKLKADMISISCGRGKRLREIRICFDKNLNLTQCGVNENQRKLCRLDKVVMPPVR